MSPSSSTTSQRLIELADYFEHALAKIYILVTLNAVLVAAVGAFFVFIILGWSTFALLQAIGFLFLGLLIGMALLRHGKRKKKLEMDKLLQAEDLKFEDFFVLIEKNQFEYAMCYALLNDARTQTDRPDQAQK